MKRIGLTFLVFLFAVVLLPPPPANAQIQLRQSVLGNGAADHSIAGGRIRATVGQRIIGVAASSTHTEESGFWYIPLPKPGAVTSPGSGVAVQPVDPGSGDFPVSITFDTVTGGGTTSLETSQAGPPPPDAFKLGNPPKYFDISTTATFTGTIEICIDYSGQSFGNESKLKLHHFTGAGWEDITTSLDTVNDIICGETMSLSPFAVFEQENLPPILAVADSSVTVPEGQVAGNSGTVGDGDGDVVTLTASAGTITDNTDGTWSWSLGTMDGPTESQSVTITAVDVAGDSTESTFALVVDNVPPSVTSISVPLDPVDIGDQPIAVSSVFADPAGSSDEPYTCTVNYGEGETPADEPGTVDGTSCTGPEHSYAEPGVYVVTVSVTDKDGGSTSEAAPQFVVIYDPDGGFVTGGGWFLSPSTACPNFCGGAAGKATFGFVSKYKKGASVPTGQTQFQFKAGDLEFHSTEYQWLVIAGAHAKYKGSGSINDDGDYGFMLTATDGQVEGGGDYDKFRIKIWEKDATETVIYDNQMGDSDDSDASQTIDGGSIVIHDNKGQASKGDVAEVEDDIPDAYALYPNYPNPFNPATTIRFDLPETARVRLVVYDLLGREVLRLVDGETKAGKHTATFDAGALPSGLYLYRLDAGSFAQTRRMILTK